MKRFRDLPLHRWALAAIVLLALVVRYEGMNRPLVMHPDEPTIIRWMEKTRAAGWLKGQTYPGGFFVMAEAARKVFERVGFQPWQSYRYHTGEINRPDTTLRPAEFGRHFNAWLGALTVLPIYLLCLRVGGSRAAAVFGAALFAGAACHVEHSHYLETDIAMVAALTLALWLWTRYAQTPRWRTLAAAAIATGYAAGTKYTLVLLMPLLLVFCLRRAVGEPGVRPWRRAGRGATWVLAALLLAALGFAGATREVLSFGWFVAALRNHGSLVYNETVGILGAAAIEPWTRQLHHLRELRGYLGSLGAGWLLLSIVGLPLLFAGGRRRFWPATLLFPGLYLLYFVFMAPFVRSQEFMNLLPALAVAASVAAAWLIERAGCLRGGTVRRVATGFFLLALLLPTARLGAAAASRCGWVDTRDLARLWLRRHLPYEAKVAGELYSPPATSAVTRADTYIYKVEDSGLPFALEEGSAFLVRNPSVTGRGLFNPRTGALYPDRQSRLDAFHAGAELLRVWSAIEPGQPRVTFRSPMLELWALQPRAAGPALELELPQPLFVGETGRETFSPAGRSLGAADGVLIDRHGREFAVGGAQEPREPVYVILNTQERAARVSVKGFGRSRGADLQPFDAVAIPLQRPWWRPRFGAFERVRARTRPQKHVTLVPCWVRVAFDATEAARLLDELGRPDRAWALLEANGGGRDPGLALRVAVATGRAAEATVRQPAAAAQLESVEKILREKTASWRLNGVSAARYEDVARLRFGVRDLVLPLALRESRGGGPDATPLSIEAPLYIPLRLAGAWTMTLEVRVSDEAGRAGAGAPLELRDAAGRLLYTGTWGGLAGPEFHPLSIAMDGAARERPIDLRWTTSRRGVLEIRNIEIRWQLADVLEAWARGQRVALARWDLGRGALTGARATGAGTPEPAPRDSDIDQRRLDFELAQAGGRAEAIEPAARRLLERAPGHYGALRALAGVDPHSAREAERLAAGEGDGVVFAPLVAIRGARTAAGKLRLVIEALRDETPPLAARVRERTFNRWKSGERVSLAPGRVLHAGERVVVELPLGAAEPARLGVSIITDVPFTPGELPVRGDTAVRVDDLPRNAARDEQRLAR